MSAIRYGVVGCGQRLRHLVELLARHPEVELAGAWDPEIRNSQELCRKGNPRGEAQICSTYEALLGLPGLQWVLVGSPNVFHRQHIDAALAAGLHVFTEKPIATTFDDCLALAQSARRAPERVLMTGFTLRYSPLYRQVKELLASGAIGSVVSIDANENLAPGHGAYIMTNWRRHYEWAGAHILEKCVHDLDLLNWFTESRPSRVAAFGGNAMFVPERAELFDRSARFRDWEATVESGLNPFTTEKTIEDTIVTILEYRNGVRAQFQLTSSNALGERRMYISGTEGTLIVELNSASIRLKTIFSPEVRCWGLGEGGDSHGGGDEVMMDELVATMFRGDPPATELHEGLVSTLVGIGVDRARRLGQIVDLEPYWRALDGRP